MSIFCGAGTGDDDCAAWWWSPPADEAPLDTRRSRKCCSCGAKVGVGEAARRIRRDRTTTVWEESKGFGVEVPLADWYLCETCGDLADSISELGFCYRIGGGESLKQQIDEYRREEAAERKRQRVLDAFAGSP